MNRLSYMRKPSSNTAPNPNRCTGCCGRIGGSKTAPAGNRGLSPTEAAKPDGRTFPA